MLHLRRLLPEHSLIHPAVELLSSQHRFSAMFASPASNATNARLVACLVDENDTECSDYRFVVDEQHVKYISTAPGTFRGADGSRAFEPILVGDLLPPFPPGEWNHSYVERDPRTGKPTFVRINTVSFGEVEDPWHPVRLNELDFSQQVRVRQQVHVTTHPRVAGGKPVLIKVAIWPWQIPSIEAETTAYQWISDCGIGLTFLGHVTEGRSNRVIGFVTEWVDGARSAEPADIEGCRKALGRLHNLGIKLGNVSKHNFLVMRGQDVIVMDFEAAKRGCPYSELEEEMEALQSSLEAPDVVPK